MFTFLWYLPGYGREENTRDPGRIQKDLLNQKEYTQLLPSPNVFRLSRTTVIPRSNLLGLVFLVNISFPTVHSQENLKLTMVTIFV
jgi:hypothetical protein